MPYPRKMSEISYFLAVSKNVIDLQRAFCYARRQMALRLYIRQHAPQCLKRMNERVAKGEIQPLSSDDLLDYRRCKCGWWMYGTTDNGVRYKPHALKVYSYAEA